jgi:hypothetical protein
MFPTTKRLQALAVTALVMAALFAAVHQPARAQGGTPPTRTITVTGFGETTSAPDTAFISIGVEVADADASTAFARANGQIAKVLEALRALNIAEKDIQTSNIAIYSQLPADARPDEQNRRVYIAQISLNIRVREAGATADGTNKVGQVLDTTIKAGANSLNGVSFGLSDPTVLLDQARTLAIADANARAQKVAAGLGVKLGKIIAFEEYPSGGPVPVADVRGGGGYGGGAQVNLGQLSASFQVRVVYEIVE